MNVVEEMQSKGLYRVAAFLGLVHLRVLGGRLREDGYGRKTDLARLICCELEVDREKEWDVRSGWREAMVSWRGGLTKGGKRIMREE